MLKIYNRILVHLNGLANERAKIEKQGINIEGQLQAIEEMFSLDRQEMMAEVRKEMEEKSQKSDEAEVVESPKA